jgi:cell wall-associated NlpC family hydrolase
MPTPNDVIKLASAYATEHYKEGANNKNIFGAWFGADNQPWCAMFVSYVFHKVGAGALVAAGNPKGFASCTVGLRWFEGHKRLVNVKTAQAGDVVFFNFSGGKTPDHVGIVISNDPKSKVLHTVEGNTVNPNGAGQANGDGVYFKSRPYRFVVAVARPNWSAVA